MKTYFELATEMGKTEVRELENRLVVLIEHLLKISYVTGRVAKDNFRGWNQTVRYQRRDLALHIERNKGLKSKLTQAMLDRAYKTALATVKEEYPSMTFPTNCQFSIEEIVGPEVVTEMK